MFYLGVVGINIHFGEKIGNVDESIFKFYVFVGFPLEFGQYLLRCSKVHLGD